MKINFPSIPSLFSVLALRGCSESPLRVAGGRGEETTHLTYIHIRTRDVLTGGGGMEAGFLSRGV